MNTTTDLKYEVTFWKDEFEKWLKSTPTAKRRERSALTLDAYNSDIKQMGEWFEKLNGEAFEPGQINSMDLKTYFAALEQNSKPATYNRKLASVRMLIQWARLAGLLDYDPAEWIPFAEAAQQSPRDVSDEEYARLEEVANAGEGSFLGLRDSLIFHLMGEAGLRISEALHLKIKEVDFFRNLLCFRGKGGKYREVMVNEKLACKIRAWLERAPKSIDGTLVTDETGYPIQRGQAGDRFGLIAKAAGVKATPHAMRHSFVMRVLDAYMQDAPGRQMVAAIKFVCQQTGDSTDVIMSYYTNPRESDMRAAMNRI